MTTLVFDTLIYAKKLKAAGVSEEQAEVQAEALAEIIDEKLATKRDLQELAYKLTIRMGAMSAAVVTILAALITIHH